MNNILKNTAKFVIGTCLTLGAVTVATSIVAGKNRGGSGSLRGRQKELILYADQARPPVSLSGVCQE